MKIGFIGLTHLGLVYLAAAASKNINVVGFHDNKKELENLKNGKLIIKEPQLNKYLKNYKNNIDFTNNISDIKNCNIVYISVDIPTNQTGKSNYLRINKLINKTINTMNKKAILIILSQVVPGYTRKIKWPLNNLFYQVETLIFGKAIQRAINPERIIIGGNFSESNKKVLPKIYETFLKNFKCKIIKMKYESAELAKISINLFLISNVSIANNLSEICTKIGADWSEIIPALRLDKRIGKYAYINPGLGLSGGNLERDLRTIYSLSSKYKTDLNTVSAFIKTSNYYKSWVLRILNKYVYKKHPKANICILGLTYKKNTNSLKNSPSIYLINKLKFNNLNIFDPVITNLSLHKNKIFLKVNVYEAIKNSEVLIIMTPWKEFKILNINKIKKLMKGNIIIDPMNILGEKVSKIANFNYFTLGKKYQL
ncbi:MAG: UDP-glucose 6-dehydrogenase TuaD [Alphaproteobacteria bacterium MarineAlpha5_Bin8]|nr:MAG: UDP-glucose 6-dehydrogenase TuaD [Alphaproteobacteria bacterium MarineAlpha5_Bin8]|tara:strand:- start:2031 stop:3308 length:1278 start_codon:yes stop_codon:yes gene_type:complete